MELKLLSIDVEMEWPINVHYKNEVVGAFRADLFVDRVLLIEVSLNASTILKLPIFVSAKS